MILDKYQRMRVKKTSWAGTSQNQNRQYQGRHANTFEALSIIFKGQADTIPDDATTMPYQTSTIPTIPEAIR